MYILRDSKGLRCSFLFKVGEMGLPLKELGKSRIEVYDGLL